ncbi:MAG TPA: RsmB/NOP family class I SAM-dependent RNA methyltransferase [Verrucomicrobiae bacterium]|nr:RsmB/NOP family class I SAM-dependent RNA methyltransferase [Verrucomicrobiae bacterium]
MKKQKTDQPAANENGFLPPLFLERLEKIIPPEHRERVMKSFEASRPAVFRLHAAAGPAPEEIPALLKQDGLMAEALPWCETAFVLKEGSVRGLQETELYHKGLLYIQGASSLLVPLVLDVRPGQHVLDMAAAPGSKTTQIALMMKGEGELTANDASRPRFFKLKAAIDAQGFQNVRLIMKDGQFLWKQFPESFDRVLLDAPCSGEARFCATSKESLGQWKPGKVKALAAKQKLLLLSAFSALKPGGVLVYSTCTFAPEENEEVISWGLGKFGPAAAVEAFEPPLLYMEGLASWGKRELDPAVRKTRRILPDGLTEAFYIAKIRKTDSWTAERKKT